MRKITWTAAVAVLLGGQVALAQTGERLRIEKKMTIIHLDEMAVEGTPDRPAGVYVALPRRPAFKSQVRLRASFVPELQRSADNL